MPIEIQKPPQDFSDTYFLNQEEFPRGTDTGLDPETFFPDDLFLVDNNDVSITTQIYNDEGITGLENIKNIQIPEVIINKYNLPFTEIFFKEDYSSDRQEKIVSIGFRMNKQCQIRFIDKDNKLQNITNVVPGDIVYSF